MKETECNLQEQKEFRIKSLLTDVREEPPLIVCEESFFKKLIKWPKKERKEDPYIYPLF
jgi:hypothetical protein